MQKYVPDIVSDALLHLKEENPAGETTERVILPFTRYDNVLNRPKVVNNTSALANGAPFNLLVLAEEEMTESEIQALYNSVS